MPLIIYFYSQLLKSIRTHEKMLRNQVSNNFVLHNLLWRYDKVCNLRGIPFLLAYCVCTGQEDERQVARFEPRQREERRDENRESRFYDFLPLCTRVDTVRGRGFNGSLWKSVRRSISKIIFRFKEIFFSIFKSILFYVCYSETLTPLSTILPAMFAKTVSCIDPWIYAINHPR